MVKPKTKKSLSFDLDAYLATSGSARRILSYQKGQVIFSQGSSCDAVFYLQQGTVKLTITSTRGREAVIALLYPGDFFGEGCVADHSLRPLAAIAVEPTTVLSIDKQEMIRVIREESQFSDRFLYHMLIRNIRIEEALTNQIVNSAEKRLARALLLVARYGKAEQPERVVVKISQEMLADMVGTTRSRISVFMNRFKKLGYIRYDGGLHVDRSLSRVVLHD
jgi:CRP/FNR family transcriptional regulator, cyclic AMP receptor protein